MTSSNIKIILPPINVNVAGQTKDEVGNPSINFTPTWYEAIRNVVATVNNFASGVAGGDLGNNYPNPSVFRINGTLLGPTTATKANLLIADGTQWNSTALSGDATIDFHGALALKTVNATVGTFQGITVNAKGLVTNAVDQGYLTNNKTITLTGDATGSGTTGITTTLATVNSNTGTFGATGIAQFTVNGKGLITAASTNTSIFDTASKKILDFAMSSSAVNYLQVTNGATGFGPSIATVGTDAAIGFSFLAKGGEFLISDSTGLGPAYFLMFGPSFTTYTGFKTNPSATQSCIYILPPADGAYNGAYLQTDTSQNLKWSTRGQLVGEFSTGSAIAGNVGEYVVSAIAVGAAVALVSATAKTVTSISLSPGDWDVEGCVVTAPAATTTTSSYAAGSSITTNTMPTLGLDTNTSVQIFTTVPANDPVALSLPKGRISLSSTTTIFLVAKISFAVSTMSAYGFISARRAR